MIGPSGRTRDVHAFATIKLSQRVKKKKKKKMLSHQNGYKCLQAVGLSDSSKMKGSKRQVSKETFHKWQRTYEEHQSMAWLHAQ